LRFDAWDLGGPGGGGGVESSPGDGGASDTEEGVDAVDSASTGAKLERERIKDFRGGETLRSIAEAERAGGGTGDVPFGILGEDRPGEAVCAREGGGGGVVGVATSVPAYKRASAPRVSKENAG